MSRLLNHFILFALISIIYLVAWNLQSSYYFNSDISCLMHCARLLLSGGSYTNDFFETNPPLILYLYIPPVIIAKIFSIDSHIVFRAYVFSIATVSLYLSYLLLNKICAKNNNLFVFFYMSLLSLIFLMLPLIEFGQREHLLVLLTIPYFLLKSYRLHRKEVSFIFSLIIGLLAGIGFAIKPHFLITWVMIEIYYYKCIFSYSRQFRVETLVILGFIIFYLITIIIYFPDYISFIVPFAIRVYYIVHSAPFLYILLTPYCIASLFIIFSYAISLIFEIGDMSINIYKELGRILWLAAIGFTISYLIQSNCLYYHQIPMFSLSLLLLLILLVKIIVKLEKQYLYFLVIFFCASVFSWVIVRPVYYLYYEVIKLPDLTKINLARFVNKNTVNQSLYFLTRYVQAFPLTDHTSSFVISRFPFMWMVDGLEKQNHFSSQKALMQHNADKTTILNMIVEDLNQKQPAFVFIEDIYLNSYFFTDNKFQQAWEHYSYLTNIFNILVYKRMP